MISTILSGSFVPQLTGELNLRIVTLVVFTNEKLWGGSGLLLHRCRPTPWAQLRCRAPLISTAARHREVVEAEMVNGDMVMVMTHSSEW